jgi:hypothetical protein
MQNFAHANCEGNFFDGVFKNALGDRFKFEQPDCDHLIVTDLQTQDVFKADRGMFSLQRKLNSDGFAGITSKYLPVSLRLGKSQRVGNYSTQEIDFRVSIPVDSKHGLTNPTVDAVALLYAYDNPATSYSVQSSGIGISLDQGVRAEHFAHENKIQWGFIEGINFALNLFMERLYPVYNENLTRE